MPALINSLKPHRPPVSMRRCIVGKSITRNLLGAITTISLSALPLQLSFLTVIFNTSSAEKAKKSTPFACQ